MTRFLAPLIFMLASFLLLWWVQVAVDAMHRDAVDSIGRTIAVGPAPALTETDAAQALAAIRQQRAAPQDLDRLSADRAELMRRSRLLWITLTLLPVLVWLWWAVNRRPNGEQPDGTERMKDGPDSNRPIA